ncbi:hypothetical protein UUU_35220 [Klebsiella pneumoniae subsp. pneumoniae DSM 30104 = JCM 1662 = NBRC 14940]|nr:hypothetical protein UUU_35220 [Klebsiella pneumoniae subsp. pneumoniae DSM 30104 = JCM 1662 = NBRC 14940]
MHKPSKKAAIILAMKISRGKPSLRRGTTNINNSRHIAPNAPPTKIRIVKLST